MGDVCDLISGQHIDAEDYNTEGKGVGYPTGPSDFGFSNPLITKWTEHPKRMAQQGDILVTVKGSGVGRSTFWTSRAPRLAGTMAVRKQPTLSTYISFPLHARFHHFQSLSTGAAIPEFSREDVLALSCPDATEEQETIVNLIHTLGKETQRLAAIYEQKQAALAELKKSLLHQAFAGEL
ncbi:MAG: hypothetical protein U0S12_08625 [Fimbriimonadales bacterium]